MICKCIHFCILQLHIHLGFDLPRKVRTKQKKISKVNDRGTVLCESSILPPPNKQYFSFEAKVDPTSQVNVALLSSLCNILASSQDLFHYCLAPVIISIKFYNLQEKNINFLNSHRLSGGRKEHIYMKIQPLNPGQIYTTLVT